jgi:hypothetical protein
VAQRTFPESVQFVEQHFGKKTHAQNVLLAQEVVALGHQYALSIQAMTELTERCAKRSGVSADA